MPAKQRSQDTQASEQAFSACLDPVCGEDIRDPARAPSLLYHGERYAFCSEHCKARFVLDPQRYLVSGVETK